ncbi:cupin domain-containing protein [Curvivirga sp.]|uniref:cupin domain-containing protein n=1 Tax=Curvivirga sp. TaxID=2856848 RepID=UPI003B5A6B54
MSKNVLKFSTASADVDAYKPDAEKVISGKPDQTIRNYYTDPTGKFSAGIWTGEVGKMKISYTEEEFCTLLVGKVKLTNADGEETLIDAGDSFVIPAGFEGTWETIENAQKIYVIYEEN